MCPWFEELPSGSLNAVDSQGATAAGFQWIWREGALSALPGINWRDVQSDGGAAVGADAALSPSWWTPAGGVVPLADEFGALPADAVGLLPHALTPGGTAIAGALRVHTLVKDDDAFRWVKGAGFERLGDPFPPESEIEPYWRTAVIDSSDDAATLIGSTSYIFDELKDYYASPMGFVWTEAGGFDVIGIPEGFGLYEPQACDAAGATIAGYAIVDPIYGEYQPYPVLWTAAAGFQVLELGGAFEDLSADGTLAAGYATTPTWNRAIVWSAGAGTRYLDEELAAVMPAGWLLTEATAIAPDGKIVAGNARDAANQQRAFVACLP